MSKKIFAAEAQPVVVGLIVGVGGDELIVEAKGSFDGEDAGFTVSGAVIPEGITPATVNAVVDGVLTLLLAVVDQDLHHLVHESAEKFWSAHFSGEL